MQTIAPYTVEEIHLGRRSVEQDDGTERIINAGTPYLSFDGTAVTYMLINGMKELADRNDVLSDLVSGQQELIEKQQRLLEFLTEQVESLMKRRE